jgi:hypothetical protein
MSISTSLKSFLSGIEEGLSFPQTFHKIRRKKNKQRKRILRKQRWQLSSTYDNRTDDIERKWEDGAMKNSAEVDDNFLSLAEERGEYFLAGTSINDHYISKLINLRTEKFGSTYHKGEEIVCTKKEWSEYTRNKGLNGWQVIEFGDQAGMLVDLVSVCFLDYSITSNSVTIKLYGDSEWVDNFYDEISKKFIIANCSVEWIYAGDGSSVTIPLLGDKLPISEMYPFLEGETVEQYYDRYLQSDASILLLIGPPGTGKTTFIRGLLHYSGKNAIVTYDEAILQKDYVFARFIEDDSGVMVLEDSDNFLKSRRDGNSMMHRFLNVGDGLITVKNKKLVFSTNLPSINDIDPALIRPGRCFDIINFSNYTLDQAKALAKKLDIDFKEEDNKKEYSLAELFHQQRTFKKIESRRLGFI